MFFNPFLKHPGSTVGPFELNPGLSDGPFEANPGLLGPFEANPGFSGPFEANPGSDSFVSVRSLANHFVLRYPSYVCSRRPQALTGETKSDHHKINGN